MLLRFRVTNYASIRDEQELSLVALDEHRDLATTEMPLGRERILPAAGIFGPNAAGKSNLIKAMDFAQTVVVESHQHWLPEEPIPRWPFRLDAVSRTAPSTFVFDFAHHDVRYEFGFRLDDTAVQEEWLYYWPKGKRSTLFERHGMATSFGPSLTGQKATIADLVRENSLFLSAAAANNHPQLRSVAAWFSSWSRMSTGGVHTAPNQPLDDEAVAMLRYADIGVIGAALVEQTPEEADRGPGPARPRRGRRVGTPADTTTFARLELLHQATTDAGGELLPWSWESSGTQTWLRLSEVAITCLRRGSLLVIDDLGCDLHPLLTAQLVGLFQDRRSNPRGAQLVFTGHDVNLLGKHVEHRLRRDQVWLTAKDPGGATALYPLTEYGRVRDGVDDVEGRYLRGRYGAVPFFDRELLEGLTTDASGHGA
ncbi:hypothetical protein J2S43_004518 [Catenuloplanes nepalensis]|uniref:ATPase AAA-type core domain-containing protein n=1 Tax=Catenuloplanes nepalensis TaxID=587533 RepID=A0ABT9MXN4_9ACTN|nr:ATP-binding protein [Catenuloplanes nepalensis]MDP9796006.1 hypothetical protein [Catenuloplanes nepalensis]